MPGRRLFASGAHRRAISAIAGILRTGGYLECGATAHETKQVENRIKELVHEAKTAVDEMAAEGERLAQYTTEAYCQAMPTSDDRVQIILPPDDLAMTDRLAQHLADQSGSAPNRSAAIRFAVRRTVEALGLTLVSTPRKKRHQSP